MEKQAMGWLNESATQTLIDAFGEEEFRFVGGAVRDAVIGKPAKDVDVTTPLAPERVRDLMQTAGLQVVDTGLEHGTVTVFVGNTGFEVTTLRKDIATDGRHATVAFTEDWKEDAKRRDFTFNALYCDKNGSITDYFGGVEDAKAGNVRFIGNPEDRIDEDALRILRFIRFNACYGRTQMQPEGLAACKEKAHTLNTLSGERIRQEMYKILTAPQSAQNVEIMQENGILPYILPGTVEPVLLEHLPEGKKDPVLALALLLRSTDDPVSAAQSVSEHWKMTRADKEKLMDLCKNRLEANQVDAEKNCKRQIRHLGKARFTEQVALGMAEGELDPDKGGQAIIFAQEWEIPEFPVGGKDLIVKGVPPGKAMGQLLRELENTWEEQGYQVTKETLLDQDFSQRIHLLSTRANQSRIPSQRESNRI